MGNNAVDNEPEQNLAQTILTLMSEVSVPEKGSGDLNVWADVIKALEQIETSCSEGWSTICGVITTLRLKIEAVILEESERTEANYEFIHKALEVMTNLSEEDLRQQLEGIVYLLPQEDTAAPVEVDEDDDPPDMGCVNINSNEDLVVYNEFLSESGEHLERIENSVLNLEEHSSREIVDEIFRCFHSIKGAAGFLGLTAMNRLCHECEGMLDRLRKNTLSVTQGVADSLLTGIDVCRRIIDSVSIALDDEEKHYLPSVDIRGALAKLKWAQEQATFSQEADPDPSRIGGALLAKGLINEEQLSGAIRQQQRPLGKILVDMGAASSDDVEKTVGEFSPTQARATDSIKVDTSRLDRLLEMVGELVIAQSQVKDDPALATLSDQRLTKNIEFANKITSNLQELVMALRLVPLRGIFHRMMRLVRDTAQKTGKNVNLQISGEDTEIDKTLSDKLTDPLVHLLRNAVDHGVETPDKRLEKDKPEQGTVKLRAFHSGGNVVIEIEDDGNGIDTNKVLQKALSKGLVESNAKLEDAEIYDLIFLPGFSTKEQATDISGRGVGMDVVRKNISALGGRVDVNSKHGKGSIFSIRLPLTMAIVDGMVVRVEEQKYILPTLSIEETFKPKSSEITTVKGGSGKGVLVRDRMVPLVSLAKVFNLSESDEWKDGNMVVVVHDDFRSCGLVIDEMLTQQQVVVKNLGQRMASVQGVSGGCILGDGRVGLILDVPGLLDLAKNI